MKQLRTLFAAVLGVALAASPALAERPRDQMRAEPRTQLRDQDRAFEAARDGRSMTLPNLKRRVMPFMEGADYLSSEKVDTETTRLKFMQGDRLIWVDVDGSGRILRRSRP